jgi:hypothetical protein
MLQLSDIDVLILLTAALAHDLGHEGFTNAYHSAIHSHRAEDSYNPSIKENFHAAELLKLLDQDKYSFVNLDTEAKKAFK